MGNDAAIYSKILIGNAFFVTVVDLNGPIPILLFAKYSGIWDFYSIHPKKLIFFSNFLFFTISCNFFISGPSPNNINSTL